MKTASRILALFLSLAIGLPAGASPELSRRTLRDESAREKKPDVVAGLEEALRGNPNRFLQLANAALTPPPASPIPVPTVAGPKPSLSAAGAEEILPKLARDLHFLDPPGNLRIRIWKAFSKLNITTTEKLTFLPDQFSLDQLAADINLLIKA